MNGFKKFLILLTSFAMVFAVTGCSSKTPSTSTTTATTLYWWRPNDDAPEATLQEIVKNYNSQNTQKIKVEVVTKDARTYEQDVLNALAANQTVSNAPDIISLNSQDLPRWVPQLTPAPDGLFDSKQSKANKTGQSSAQYVANLYDDAVVKSVLFNDSNNKAKVYGLPIGVDNLALYINTSLIQKAVDGLSNANAQTKSLSRDELNLLSKKIQTAPATWTDLVAIAPYLTVKNGNDITSSAIALGTAQNIERAYDIVQTLMLQTGTQMTNDNLDTATFNQAQSGAASTNNTGEAALKFYLRFSNPNDPVYTWNDKMPDSVDAFMQGQVAMMINYADIYRFMVSETPSIKSQINVAALPQVSNPNSPTSSKTQKTIAKMRVEAAVSAKGNAAKQAAAWDFIQWVTSKSGSSDYLSAMKISSPLKDVSGKSKFEAFDKQKSIADVWYKGSSAMKVDELFLTMIDDAYNGRKSPKDALDKAASDTTTILQASKSKWSITNATSD